MTGTGSPGEKDALRASFIEGMSRAVASVCVVTTDGPAGRGGVTVSAMTSISADGPQPTMLTCINAEATPLPQIRANGVFCINVLRVDQAEVSDVFASRRPGPGDDKFSAVETEPMVTGAPRLTEALASFDCRLMSSEKIGTHHICIGAVEAVTVASDGDPLLYGMRRYLRAQDP